jgi:hypothetical protein
MSIRNRNKSFWRVERGRRLRLTTHHHLWADCLDSVGSTTLHGLLRDSFTLLFFLLFYGDNFTFYLNARSCVLFRSCRWRRAVIAYGRKWSMKLDNLWCSGGHVGGRGSTSHNNTISYAYFSLQSQNRGQRFSAIGRFPWLSIAL